MKLNTVQDMYDMDVDDVYVAKTPFVTSLPTLAGDNGKCNVTPHVRGNGYRKRSGGRKPWMASDGTAKIAESIIRALAEPVVVLDGDLRAVVANPAFCETLRITPGQLVGHSVQDLISVENGQHHLKAFLDTVVAYGSNGRVIEVECTVPPHSRKVLSVSARRVRVEENLAELVFVELRDVTRERDTARGVQEWIDALLQRGRDLEESNKELDSFTHSVSHDLRLPLRLTNRIAHLLLQDHGAQLPADAMEKIQMILDSTSEMGKLIEDLLAFSQVKCASVKKRRVDLCILVREVIEELRDEQQGRSVQIAIGELPPCRADRALLKQVFLNLLENALKFTRPCTRAEIHVGFMQSSGETAYFVRDNGVGFDMAHLESMFEAFHRFHRADDFEGSGIGLSLVRRILERHDGRIWAEGARNQGATFYFTLGN